MDGSEVDWGSSREKVEGAGFGMTASGEGVLCGVPKVTITGCVVRVKDVAGDWAVA
jgi:hypothetical protein